VPFILLFCFSFEVQRSMFDVGCSSFFDFFCYSRPDRKIYFHHEGHPSTPRLWRDRRRAPRKASYIIKKYLLFFLAAFASLWFIFFLSFPTSYLIAFHSKLKVGRSALDVHSFLTLPLRPAPCTLSLVPFSYLPSSGLFTPNPPPFS